MLNYFNYFTEIEEHFQRKRGAQIYLSPVDWALIESWKDAGIPLAAVLEGIDRAFDKFESGRRTDSARLRSLVYCSAAVLESAEAMREAAVGGRADESIVARDETQDVSFAAPAVAAFLAGCATQLRGAKLPTTASTARDEIAAALAEESAAFPRLGSDSRRLEHLERLLTVWEDKLFMALEHASPVALLLGLREDLERQLAPHRRSMRAEQIVMLERQFIRKRLFERYQLPRLSLFHMGTSSTQPVLRGQVSG